jgi:hypothetical protein
MKPAKPIGLSVINLGGDNVINICLILCSGKGIEYPFPKAVYTRDPLVLSNSHVLRNVFDFKIKGIKQEGHRGYSKKATVRISPQHSVFTKNDCVFLMNEYLSLSVNAGIIVKDNYPTFDDHNGYYLADHWMEYLTIDDLAKIFAISQMWPSVPDLGTFLKMSTNS